MRREINVDGTKYEVVESVRFNRAIEMWLTRVSTPDGSKIVVRKGQSGRWRFWTAEDRVADHYRARRP